MERITLNLSPAATRIKTENIQTKGAITSEHESIKTEEGYRDRPEITKEKVNDIVETFNKFLNPTHTALKFEFHEKLHEYYVTIVDSDTNELIKEIPPKKLLDFYAQMTDFLGIMIDKKI
ncbi:flagellar protein FlaG [Peribacillus sp. SCS-37]|uniref:flagellar protein FlaG n=1 Tax=Paraperibacillus esterisolvens TaxID=3115296 RepID=UPI0039057CD1